MIKRTKRKIEDVRREELIQAAHRVFLVEGLTGLTTARICAEAGMSPGILAYYFKGKEDVLFQMVRYNNRILMEDITRRLRAAATPWERLVAIIEGNFPEEAFHRAQASAWVSVSAAAANNDEFAKLQRYFYRRLRSNVTSALKPLIPTDHIRPLVITVGALIDGLWVRKASGEEINRDDAVALTLTLLRAMLGSRAVAAMNRVPQRRRKLV